MEASLAMPFIFLGIFIVAGVCGYIADRRKRDKIEDELDTAEERISETAARIADSTEAVRESEALADRAAENQRGIEDYRRRIEEKTDSVTDLVKSGRSRAERIADLVDECQKIIEEGKVIKK